MKQDGWWSQKCACVVAVPDVALNVVYRELTMQLLTYAMDVFFNKKTSYLVSKAIFEPSVNIERAKGARALSSKAAYERFLSNINLYILRVY